VKRIVILGAGTAGTMAANQLRKRLERDVQITVVDEDPVHYYQPGFLFIPFGTYSPDKVTKPKARFIPKGVNFVKATITELVPEQQVVRLGDGTELPYDYLIIATGTHPTRSETPGLDSSEYGKTIHDFYSYDGAVALHDAIEKFDGGTLVVNLIELPIKCPVAPLEFAFLADAYFEERGIRDNVTIKYVTPMSSAFTKPVAAKRLGDMFERRGIDIEPDFYVERVDADRRTVVSFDEREVEYDLLVTVPVNKGAAFLGKTGIVDELNHVKVDSKNFQSPDFPSIFAIGDAAALPSSKAGSVAHFAMETFVPNFIEYINGSEMTHEFDGHANCFIETGHDKAMLIDFNYFTEPLPGKYPVPKLGPMSLLEETRRNHWGKLGFKWLYWHMLLPGRRMPVKAEMSMAGKIPVTEPDTSKDNI